MTSKRDSFQGVLCSLKFSSHIRQTVAKAHARASIVHKCSLSKNQHILLKAYVTYVLPLLEYRYMLFVYNNNLCKKLFSL